MYEVTIEKGGFPGDEPVWIASVFQVDDGKSGDALAIGLGFTPPAALKNLAVEMVRNGRAAV